MHHNINCLMHVWILDADLLCHHPGTCDWCGLQCLTHIRLLEQLLKAKPASVMDQIYRPTSLQNYMFNFTCTYPVKANVQIHSKKILFCSLLNFWVFIWEGSPGCMTTTCAAYAACTNRPMPNRKFLLWNSIAVIRGSLQTAWSDLNSSRAATWFAHLVLTGWYRLIVVQKMNQSHTKSSI